jgi:hypothetical protein
MPDIDYVKKIRYFLDPFDELELVETVVFKAA